MNEIDYIKSKMSKTELLAALAEECSELAQAALKLRRILDGSNPTPVSEDDATKNLLEEYGDVINCIESLIIPDQNETAMEMRKAKKTRWAKRLKEAEQNNFKVETNVFDQEEIHENCTVQVLKNTVTGEVSVGWWKNE